MLRVDDATVSFGGVRAVDGVSLAAAGGEVLSIIGPNGAGKTTLFNIVSGIYRPDRGRVLLEGTDVTGLPPEQLAAKGLSRTFQNLQIFFRMSVVENVMVGLHLHEQRGILAHLLALPGTAAREDRSRERARQLLEFVGLAREADRPAGALAYGALKRLELARALATAPRLLLLDEPAAGCNPAETAQLNALIRKIAGSGVAVVLVEHDMKLVMSISDRIVVLVEGRVLLEGPPRRVAGDPRVVAAYLGTAVATPPEAAPGEDDHAAR